MSHQIIIRNAVVAVLQDPEVRAELTTSQLARVDSICAQELPCDDDFRFLSRMQNKAYCEAD